MSHPDRETVPLDEIATDGDKGFALSVEDAINLEALVFTEE